MRSRIVSDNIQNVFVVQARRFCNEIAEPGFGHTGGGTQKCEAGSFFHGGVKPGHNQNVLLVQAPRV